MESEISKELGEPADGLSETDQDILDRIAQWVVERRMTVPAILLLESHRPLSFVASQAMIAARPVVGSLEPFFRGILGRGFSYEDFHRFAELMEYRENLEELIVTIERENQSAKNRQKEEKAKRKALKRELRAKRRELKRSRRDGAIRGDS